ncbi:MAG: hypothetical protein R2705_16515 [Ilumatobacteraceae bacterium]
MTVLGGAPPRDVPVVTLDEMTRDEMARDEMGLDGAGARRHGHRAAPSSSARPTSAVCSSNPGHVSRRRRSPRRDRR